MNQLTIREVLMGASRFLEERGIRSAQFNAEVLLQHVLGWNKTRMIVEWNSPLDADKRAAFEALLQRRGAYEPLQYLTGVQEFYGREFQVSPAVLIPRPETELLVEKVLEQKALFANGGDAPAKTEARSGSDASNCSSATNGLDESNGADDSHGAAVAKGPLIADIGTGSGAIALTLAAEWPEARVVAVDISPDALAMAKQNAERLGVAERVTFLEGDLVTPLLERGLRPDIVVSNPPYIPSRDCEELDEEVRAHEPRLALDGGEDGLYPYRIISAALPQLWPATGAAFVAYEVGIHQDRDVEAMIAKAVAGVVTGIRPDLAGIGRVIWGRRDTL